ncbi:MAG: hypothetical protein ACI8R4_002961 [Paracoccaceae bacterium]|jgi:hypothetical protein
MADELFDPTLQPSPDGGWSQTITTLENATVVPPVESGFVQAAGLLDSEGNYCAQGALWRKYRPLTTAPEAPEKIAEEIPGRWLWGGVLWAHFGHFLVESTARLWAVDHLDKPIDGILFIPKRPKVGESVRGFQKDFIHLMSPDTPIRVAAEPVRVQELVVPGQGFGLGKITTGTQKFRDALHNQFARDIEPDGPEKIYISRSALGLGKGGLLGEERLEQLLEAQGYTVFHPQKHDIATQIARYKAAKQVIAADGSALHMFAMVGRPDQQVAMILRRKSGAHNLLSENVTHFCGRPPLVISALRTEWVKAGKQRSNRQSFGELNLLAIGQALGEAGFVDKAASWPDLNQQEREQIFADKGLTGNDEFVESPDFVRKRVRAIRQARRADRADV